MRYIAEIRTYDYQWLLVGKAEYLSDLFLHSDKIYRQTENMIHIKADQNLKNHYFLRIFPFLKTTSPLVLI